MGVFDIVGPIMIGPSSSHTAGAARLGKMALTILGERPVLARITLYGSFAKTYKGHGTDKALVAGLLGFSADDPRMIESLQLAKESGLEVHFQTKDTGDVHPNTAGFLLETSSGRTVNVLGASVGGGSVVISKIEGFQVDITGELHTLVIIQKDIPGIIAGVTQILAQENINVAFMRVSRQNKGDQALMIVEVDQIVPQNTLTALRSIPSIESVLMIEPL
jgi:L-serine dehydratase